MHNISKQVLKSTSPAPQGPTEVSLNEDDFLWVYSVLPERRQISYVGLEYGLRIIQPATEAALDNVIARNTNCFRGDCHFKIPKATTGLASGKDDEPGLPVICSDSGVPLALGPMFTGKTRDQRESKPLYAKLFRPLWLRKKNLGQGPPFGVCIVGRVQGSSGG